MRPLDEHPDDPTRRNSGRVQTQTRVSRPKQLQAVASPVDSYVRPEQAPVGSNGWESLAKALAGIQPSINQFFEIQAQEAKGGDVDINAVNAFLLPLSPEERQRAIREGRVPGLKSLAGREAAAERIAYDTMNRWDQEFSTSFDPVTGNIDQWVAERAQPLLERYGNDPLFRNVFATKIAPYVDKLKGKAGELHAAAELEATEGTIFEKWMSKARFEKAEGKSPNEIFSGIFGEFQKNQEYNRLDFKTQQRMVLQMANQFATAGEYDLAREALLFERKGGPYKGSLMTDAQFGIQASQIMDRIDTEQRKQMLAEEAATAEEQVRSDMLDKFLKGRVSETSPIIVPTASGGTKEISPEEQEKMAAETYLSKSDQIAAERGETKEQQFDRELAVFGSNGTKHNTWFQIINAGFQASSIANLAATGELPPALDEGYEMYLKLHGKNAAYLAKHTEAKAADFYEMVRVAQQDMGLPKEAAMRNAAAYLAPGSQERQSNRRIEREKLQNTVADAISGIDTGWRWWNPATWGNAAPVNEQYVKEEIARYAQIYMGDGQGLSEDKALEAAQTRFLKNHIIINGEAIKRDPRMPEFFQEAVQQYIHDFAERNKAALEAAGIEESDLTIKQIGSTQGVWYIYNRSSNEYLPARTFPGQEITYLSLADMKRREREAAEQEVTKNHQNNR
jgi:hypothetical protein